MNQLATTSASDIASNLRRSGPFDVLNSESSALYLDAFRLSRDARNGTTLTARDLRCVDRCAGEFVDAVARKIPGNTLALLSSVTKHVGVAGSLGPPPKVRYRRKDHRGGTGSE